MCQIASIEFLESHTPDHAAIFHYMVLVHLQVETERGKAGNCPCPLYSRGCRQVGVLDVVARFRVRNMSGYVTVYCGLAGESRHTSHSISDLIKTNADCKEKARKEFFAPQLNVT